MGIPVVIAENGFGLAVTDATEGGLGLSMTVAENGYGIPVTIATNGYGTPAVFDPPLTPAEPAAPVNTPGFEPVVSGTTQVSQTLTCFRGIWTGYPTPTYGYEWFRTTDDPATITSANTVSNAENSVLVHALTATETVTWSLQGGDDLAKFELSGSTLRWASNGTKNYEAPDDADANNAYVVIVRATDSASNTTDQTITVTVTDVPETTLTFDFMANTSVIAGASSTAVAPITVTRNLAAYADNVAGVWSSFAINTARRTDKGLLIEEARTNVCLQSRTLTNASWVKTNCTAVKDQTGIDGVASSASRITATAANGTCLLTTSIASSARFQTAFVKRLVGTGNIQMTQNNGSTWTTVTTTAGWTRVTCPTVTAANPVVGFRIVTSGDSVAIDMVQNENSGTFATSPIPTTTAAVPRPADVVVINTAVAPLASWFTQAAGTLFAEGEPYGATLATSTVFQIDSGAATNLHYVGLPGGTAAAGGTTTASSAVGTFNGTRAVGVNKSAWAYALNDMAGSHNGAAVVPDATGTMPASLTTTRLGGLVAATYWSGYLRKITFMSGRLDNAALQALTVP